MTKLDREIFNVELHCVLLPIHGLTKELPFSLEIESKKKSNSYSFSVLTKTKEKIISISSIVHHNLIKQSYGFNNLLKRIISVHRYYSKKFKK